jgi:hypothetical protein
MGLVHGHVVLLTDHVHGGDRSTHTINLDLFETSERDVGGFYKGAVEIAFYSWAYAYNRCKRGIVRLAKEHSLFLQGSLDDRRRYACGGELSIANRQNCLEALLKELGLYSLGSRRSAL